MTRRRLVVAALVVSGVCWRGLRLAPDATASADTLPARLTDQEFWKLIDDLSEPRGSIRTANLVSNEQRFQHVIPELTRIATSGRAFIGVGPEQNFTYIAALRPSVAFIVDIRPGNLDLHLLYKAILELSADRAEFVSRLLSRTRPRRLNARSTASEIFSAYSTPFPNWELYKETTAAIRNQLLGKHGFDVSADDLRALEEVHRAFYVFGPRIRYGAQPPPPFSSAASAPWGLVMPPNGARNQPTYAELMTATDGQGVPRGFLSSEQAFSFVKDLESRNLIVPVVGDFAGPKTVRAVGTYLKQKGATVSAFYVSNVEEYLRRDGTWRDFCANVSTLPLDDTSTFIRSMQSVVRGSSEGLLLQLGRLAQIADCR
jgi:hypothetical protein